MTTATSRPSVFKGRLAPSLRGPTSSRGRLCWAALRLAPTYRGYDNLYGFSYILSLLVAVLDRPENFGLTTIEEPERGLHPTAIQELIALIRDQATANQPIWMTTHSESVVRQLRLEELVLVNKSGGRTRMKIADAGNLSNENLAPLGLDEAWLSNLLDGGTP